MSSASTKSQPILEARGLGLSRGGRSLWFDIDFSLGRGEALVLRGPNGAGKSSLLLVISGALRPEEGMLVWAGGIDDKPALHFYGTAPAVKTRLTLAENLEFWRAMNGASGLPVDGALELVGLGSIGDIEAGHLSTGQTKRLALARLLVSERPVWLLDEPTASLDADGKKLVGELVSRHCAAGGIAVVATHQALPLTVDTRTLTLGSPL